MLTVKSLEVEEIEEEVEEVAVAAIDFAEKIFEQVEKEIEKDFIEVFEIVKPPYLEVLPFSIDSQLTLKSSCLLKPLGDPSNLLKVYIDSSATEYQPISFEMLWNDPD